MFSGFYVTQNQNHTHILTIKAEIHLKLAVTQALNWEEKHLYLVINVWSHRSDLERHWFVNKRGQASM